LISQQPNIRIAVDAMGGDYAPANVVAGVLDAVKESGDRFSVLLVGQREKIQQELDKHPCEHTCAVVDAREIVTMDDVPNTALKTKKDSSITVGITLHRDGKADAFVSAGNTGAVMSASTLILGRLGDIGRPTIGALIPTEQNPCLLVDAGANVDSRPRHLFEFGVMGSVYVSSVLGNTNPRVGMLSIGEEDSKGNEASLEASRLLRESRLNFVGNVEGRDILKGKVDVAVCDGFVGNILLKFGESIPPFLKAKFSAYAKKSLQNAIVALIARRGMKAIMSELDYQEHGGVPLLGVNGVSIIGHGRSTPKAIKNMIYRAEEMITRNVNAHIQEAILSYA
jgi:glycerol-3-phosphate acyltransferase PlsX